MSDPSAIPPIAPAETPARRPFGVPDEAAGGVFAAVAAYGLWGFLPILFRLLDGVPSTLIVVERILWSVLLVGGYLLIRRRLGEVWQVLAVRRRLMAVTSAALVLGCNWLLYVWAVESEQLLAASFGYFINPLINVALGMVLLGERQNRWQTVSILIAVVGIAVQAVGIGGVPFIALGLAMSFGLYGFFRKTAGVGATVGLMAETLVMTPLALGYLAWFTATNGAGPHADPTLLVLLMLTGPATAVPLLLFAYAVQRLRLTAIGMFQYIAPSIQFVVAIVLFGEHLNEARLVSFALIWLSLMVFTLDSLRQRRKRIDSAAQAV